MFAVLAKLLVRPECRHTVFADGTHGMMVDDSLHLYSLVVSLNGKDTGVPIAHFITTSKEQPAYEWFLRCVRDVSPLALQYPTEFRIDMEVAAENGIYVRDFLLFC